MFIFQYDGMFQKIWPGEKYSRRELKKKDLDAIINLSRNYRGQRVVVVFDNNKDKDMYRFPIGVDLVNSTIREGILGKVNESKITFEDSSIIIPTKRFVDMIRYEDICNPEPTWVSPFLFDFFYHSRGEKTFLFTDPINAFKDGKEKYARPKSKCEQAFLIKAYSPSYDMHMEDLPERSSKQYQTISMKEDFIKNQNFLIRCHRKTG